MATYSCKTLPILSGVPGVEVGFIEVRLTVLDKNVAGVPSTRIEQNEMMRENFLARTMKAQFVTLEQVQQLFGGSTK